MPAGIGNDIRYALRVLAGARAVTLIATLSLAVGIGVNTTIFSLGNALLLRPLPVADPDHLLRVGSNSQNEDFGAFSYPEYLYLRDHNQVFSGLIAHFPTDAAVKTGDAPAVAWTEVVSGNYFTVLGIRPAAGRGFLPEEDSSSAAPVAVISHRMWQRDFNLDPVVAGRSIKVNGRDFTIVGVAQAGFTGTFVGFSIDLWLPVAASGLALPRHPSLDRRDNRFLMLIGRLHPGASTDRARSDLETLAGQMETAYPESNRGRAVSVAAATGVHPFVAGLVKFFLALLMGTVGLVMLIVCANIASLLMARAAARRHEIAVRLTLGASRLRLMRQFLTESVMLAIPGGLGGLLVAFFACRFLTSLHLPTGVPVSLNLNLDWRVFAFTSVLSVGTGIVFGLAPAIQAARADLLSALKHVPILRGSLRLRNLLVVLKVAVSFLLLAGATLLLRSLQNSRSLDPGFDPRGVVVISFDPGLLGYADDRSERFYRDLQRRVSSVPGVQGSCVAAFVPMSDRGDEMEIAVEGVEPPANQRGLFVGYNLVDPNYFRMLGIPLVSGRGVSEQDRRGSPGIVIVNETFTRRFFQGQNPIGKRITLGRGSDQREIAGVVRDTKYSSLGEAPRPFLYLAVSQYPRWDLTLHARTAADPGAMLAAMRREALEIDPDIPITDARTMADAMAFSQVPVRVAGVVLSVSGGVALLLASIGLYGVVAYTVSNRNQEIGIRMALGAEQRDVIRLILRQGMRLTITGLFFGVAGALALTRLLAGLLYGVGSHDLLTLLEVALLLGLAALLACWGPTRRVARADPMAALRRE